MIQRGKSETWCYFCVSIWHPYASLSLLPKINKLKNMQFSQQSDFMLREPRETTPSPLGVCPSHFICQVVANLPHLACVCSVFERGTMIRVVATVYDSYQLQFVTAWHLIIFRILICYRLLHPYSQKVLCTLEPDFHTCSHHFNEDLKH